MKHPEVPRYFRRNDLQEGFALIKDRGPEGRNDGSQGCSDQSERNPWYNAPRILFPSRAWFPNVAGRCCGRGSKGSVHKRQPAPSSAVWIIRFQNRAITSLEILLLVQRLISATISTVKAIESHLLGMRIFATTVVRLLQVLLLTC